MLQEWRQRSRPTGSTINDMESANKRARYDDNSRPPPLPPSSSSIRSGDDEPVEKMTALERIRLKRQAKVQQQYYSSQQENDHSFDDSFGAVNMSSMYDDTDDVGSYRTSSRRKSFMAGGARRKSVMLPRSTENEPPLPMVRPHGRTSNSSGISGATMSQLTTESDHSNADAEKEVDSVEGAGLRSQIRELQQRIDQLEKEKMGLSMAKAPLEARFRQKEDSWIKDQSRMIQEIESLKLESRKANERYKDVQAKFEAAEEEVRHLKLQVRKAASSLNSSNHASAFSNPTGWSRQLQNDRDVADLKEKLRAAADDLDGMRLAKVSIEKELHATKIELDSMARAYEELQEEHDEIVKTTSDNRDAEIQLAALTVEHIAASAQLNAVCADLAATKARAEAASEAKEEAHKKEIEHLHFEMSVLKTRAGSSFSVDGATEEEDEAVLKARLEERDRRIAELEAEVLKGEELRRKMHNRIQELRGNIRVFVRTRPFLPSDGQLDGSAIDVSPDGESLSILDARSNANHGFKFDKVFPPSSGQDHIFQEVSDFVQSALDGYQVCLFSYGQTGSGKTHTMQGSGSAAMRGIIPRAVEQILSQAKVLVKQKWTFSLSASFLEIYNENLKDLLTALAKNERKGSQSAKLAIKRNREGKSYVEGLTEVPIDTSNEEIGSQQLEALMAAAARARSVASTKMNAQSSRSHSVFMLHIRGYNGETSAEVHGSLNLCDLAGSERLDRSGANTDAKRLRETQSINKSLSCLGDVFNALAQGASHIPYRNSKLTYLLQDCLSGDGKALMFVNLSPTTESSNESLCSLRFAQRVNQVELGKPTKNIQYKR